MADRTNEQWLAELRPDHPDQADAIEDLRARLKRSIFYYLSRERSDLSSLATQEIDQMAQDMAQDAVLRVLDNIDTFRGASRFTTWATKIAIRMAISDLRRAHYKDYSLDDLTIGGELLPSLSDAQPAPTQGPRPPNPESATERDDVMEKISAAIEEALTERQRAALVAIAIDGVPLEIVAERLDTNRNALYKLLHDARKKLRTHLEAQGLNMDYMMNLFGR
ncbi:MAG: sigma-70 family RNA polymerase sigma factor [Chloroflexota bacterium]